MLSGAGDVRYALNHTHFIYPDGLVSLLAKMRSGLPYVVTAHGSDVPGYNPNRFKLLHRVLRPVWGRIIRGSSEIVCPSRSLQSLIRRQSPQARTAIIPNGFDPARLRPGLPKVRRILVVSRLFERKGVQYLLRAASGLDGCYEIDVVGDGPYLPELKRIASQVDAPVRFRGWLDNDSAELKELYERSSIFVLPSEAENFPIVLLEAMAAGAAIVTIRDTGSAEVVGESALLARPRDPDSIRRALVLLMSNPPLRRELGRDARERLEQHFSWNAVARKYLDLYRRHARQDLAA